MEKCADEKHLRHSQLQTKIPALVLACTEGLFQHYQQHSECLSVAVQCKLELPRPSYPEFQSSPSQAASASYLSVAARQPCQAHSGHVKQPDLPVVVGQGDDPLANTDVNPAHGRQEWVIYRADTQLDTTSLRSWQVTQLNPSPIRIHRWKRD